MGRGFEFGRHVFQDLSRRSVGHLVDLEAVKPGETQLYQYFENILLVLDQFQKDLLIISKIIMR